jgi:uncharacterized protein (DUF1330 family)
MAKAYLIVEVDTHDEASMADYRTKTPEAIGRFGGRFIVRGGTTESLEGGWAPPRLVMIEFPSMAKAKEFYTSAHYAPLLKQRLAAGTCRAILAEGVPE